MDASLVPACTTERQHETLEIHVTHKLQEYGMLGNTCVVKPIADVPFVCSTGFIRIAVFEIKPFVYFRVDRIQKGSIWVIAVCEVTDSAWVGASSDDLFTLAGDICMLTVGIGSTGAPHIGRAISVVRARLIAGDKIG